MRYGVYVSNSKKTAQALLDRALHGNVIWTNQTVKGLLTDLITLHEEVEHLEAEREHHRTQATLARQERLGAARRGW